MKNIVSQIEPMMVGEAGGGGMLGRMPGMTTNTVDVDMPDIPG